MATLTASAAQLAAPIKLNHIGDTVVHSQYSASASLSATDVVQMVKIPRGAKVTDVVVTLAVIQSYSVGDGDDDARYYATASIVATTTQNDILQAGHGYQYSQDDTIDIRADAPSVTAINLYKMTVRYHVDDTDNFPDG